MLLANASDTTLSPLVQTLLGQSLEIVLGLLTVTVMPALLALLRNKASESSAARVSLVFAEAAASAVAQVDAELKPKIKAAIADGVLTADEKVSLKEEAMNILKKSVAPQLWEQAKAHFGPLLEQWVAGKFIERAVTERRAVQASDAAKTAGEKVVTVGDASKVLGGQ